MLGSQPRAATSMKSHILMSAPWRGLGLLQAAIWLAVLWREYCCESNKGDLRLFCLASAPMRPMLGAVRSDVIVTQRFWWLLVLQREELTVQFCSGAAKIVFIKLGKLNAGGAQEQRIHTPL